MASPSPVRRSSRHQNILAKHEENDPSKSNDCSKEANIDSISLVKSKNASPMVNGGRQNQLDNGGVLQSNGDTNSKIKPIISALPGNALSNCGKLLRTALKSSPRINDTPGRVLQSNPDFGPDDDSPQGNHSSHKGLINGSKTNTKPGTEPVPPGKPSSASGRFIRSRADSNPEDKLVHDTPPSKHLIDHGRVLGPEAMSISKLGPVNDTPLDKHSLDGGRALRSRTNSNPEAKHVNDTTPSNSVMMESNPEVESFNNTIRRRGRKKASVRTPNNEYSAIIDRVRYLLRQIKSRQNLINAYSGRGRKGQRTDNVYKKDTHQAESDILKFKLEIRALFQHIDSALSEGQIDRTLFDSEGQIDSEDIYCAKCNSKYVSNDNDIILCDGMCVRAFHQKCLNPPLLTENIPVGDDGWLCPACECKIDCIKLLIEFLGSTMELTDTWEKVFPEADVIRNGNKNDFALPPGDSDGCDIYPGDIKNSATSVANSGTVTKFGEVVLAEPDWGLNQENEKLLEKGKIERLDYKKFHDETYGSSSSDSTDNENWSETYDTSDDDWRAPVGRSKRKRHARRYKNHQKFIGNTHNNQDHQERAPVGRPKRKRHARRYKNYQKFVGNTHNNQDHEELHSSANNSSVSPYRKIDKAIQQKLYEYLLEHQYPTTEEKEILAQEVGIGYDQVCRWFNNTRYKVHHGFYTGPGSPKADKHPKRKTILPVTPLKEGTMISEIDMGASPISFPVPNPISTYVSAGDTSISQIDKGASLNNSYTVNMIDMGVSPNSFSMPSAITNFVSKGGSSSIDEQANTRENVREKVVLEIPLKEGTSLSQIDIKRQQAIARELKKMKQGR